MTRQPIGSASPRNPGPPVLIDLPRFRARSVRASDASQEIADWFADAERVAPLNMAPRRLSVPDLRRFFASFDNRTRYLVALLAKPDEAPCGFFHSEIDPTHRVSRISYLNGPNHVSARRAMACLGLPLLRLQFRRTIVEKVVAQVAQSNVAIATHIERIGFKREGLLRAQVRSWTGEGRIDQIFYGLLPDDLPSAQNRKV